MDARSRRLGHTPRRRRTWRPKPASLAVAALLVLGGTAAARLHRAAPPVPRPVPVVNQPLIDPRPPVPAPPRPKTHPKPPAAVTPLPAARLIVVPPQSQFPQLPNGCEVTSLSMLLTAVGHPVSKLTLAALMPKDPTPLRLEPYTAEDGQTAYRTVYWGNPNVGFVGSVYNKNFGYGIYNGPLLKLLDQVLPGRGINLTGDAFRSILAQVGRGIPVEVWTTLTFRPTTDWVTWQSPEGPVHATPLEHAVLLVGYKGSTLYVNNPWTDEAAEPVAEAPFVAAWHQLGNQAISVAEPDGGSAGVH